MGIETIKERTQNMYDLLYAGQISVDTRATRRQQRIALKRLKKSNLNLRPSKIRELAKQMKKEAENAADTISSGIESGQTETDSYDSSKAESNDTETKGNFSALNLKIFDLKPRILNFVRYMKTYLIGICNHISRVNSKKFQKNHFKA